MDCNKEDYVIMRVQDWDISMGGGVVDQLRAKMVVHSSPLPTQVQDKRIVLLLFQIHPSSTRGKKQNLPSTCQSHLVAVYLV